MSLYVLPKLTYAYDALEPHISQQQLLLHHQKHHQAYVDGANSLLVQLDEARKKNTEIDSKAVLKALSFNVGGHVLHSLFWENIAPEKQSAVEPEGSLADVLNREFGSFTRFKQEFTQAALSVEGSGWAALSYCQKTQRPLIMQIEKHHVNVFPMFKILLVLDVWEHAYYLDYQNLRAKFIEAFWKIVDFKTVQQRFESIKI